MNRQCADGSAGLLVAVQNGFDQVAVFLLDHGADPNLPNLKGWTPPYLAVKNRNVEDSAIPGPPTAGALDFTKLLLDRGANPNQRINADTELHQGMLATWLKEAGATPLIRASLSGDLTVVRLLLAHGADPSITTNDNGADYGFGARTVRMTPLNWAEGVPIGMSSAIYHTDTVALLTRLMKERGIPVVTNALAKE